MTGFGSYCYVVWGIWLRHCLNGRQEDFRLKWPSYFSIPEVVPREQHLKLSNTNGHTNGHAKKTS